MKKVLIVLLMFVMFIPLNTKAFTNYYTFIKMDEEGNLISDAEFKLHSLDGSIEYNVTNKVLQGKAPTPMSTIKLFDTIELGQYEFVSSGIEDYNKLLNILGPEERKIVEDLKTYSKFEEYNELFNQNFSSNYARVQVTRGIEIRQENECPLENPTPQLSTKEYKVKRMENDEESIRKCPKTYISIPVYMVLEETKAPEGLKKEKAIVEYNYNIIYYFDDDYNYENVYVGYNVVGLYKYNYDIDYSNILDMTKKIMLLTNDDELYFKNDCGNYYNNVASLTRTPSATNSIKEYHVSKMEESNCLGYPVIIDHKNGAVLTISSYVNNGGSTKAVKGSQVKYKVVVKNEGSSDSINNVITSKIPDGFEYVKESASDNGRYIESVNAVIWNIDNINTESTKELTYKVNVTEDVDLDKVYTSTATIISDSSDEIISNETTVTLQGEIENPKTGDARNIVILFILSVAGLIIYYILDRKTIKGL